LIRIRVLGSLRTQFRRDEFNLDLQSISLAEAIRTVYASDMPVLSEALSNILVAVNGSLISGGFGESILEAGDEVTLIPISHGG
jgi:molybdopterin converting factor small subunit